MLLKLNFSGDTPIYQQIRNQIVVGIASGELSAGERLPAIRTLADEAGVNMMTVNKAYAILKQEGYISSDRRAGTVVAGAKGGAVLSRQSEEALRVIISEASLAGMDRESFLGLCERLFLEGRGENG
ncbi:MAG: GntR family transcriptional regulator [Oscillospiraceae bacterium]